MTRVQSVVIWGWLLFEFVSGIYFSDEGWVFKATYFLVTAIPFWFFFAFLILSQIAVRVYELEKKIGELSSK